MDSTKPTFIYTLSCPISGSVKYVGKTIKPLKDRLSEHCADLRGRSLRKNWIKSLKKKGLRPVIELLDCVGEDWAYWEVYWIAQFRTWGFTLKNQTIGGDGVSGILVSDDTKRRMSIAQKGKRKSPQAIINAVAGRRATGNPYSTPSTKAKQSAALKGRPKTEEHRINAAKARKGIKWSEEMKKKKSLAMKGIRVAWMVRPIIAIEDSGVRHHFDAITDGAKHFSILGTSISNCLKGRSKKAGGIKWIYQDK